MLAGTVFFLIISSCYARETDLSLKQIVVLSRHNIRTPLTANLESFTPKKWPVWQEKPGHLTKKGAVLEGYMGEFFFAWLNNQGFLPDSCPEKDSVFIYANTKDRTKESAKAFARSAFRNCNIEVHHKNITGMDPVFNPVIHNDTKQFKKNYIKEMEDKLSQINLTASFEKLDAIIDIKNSYICKEESYCNLLDKSYVLYSVGEEPNITGPLHIGNSVVDAFVMSYYEGNPMDEVAWGEIERPEQWQLLTEITKYNQKVRFDLPNLSKDFAEPLLKYMAAIFTKNNDPRKFILLMGHDSNLSSLMSALKFKPFRFPDQYEPYPIGGKLVFQKLTDGKSDYLKVEYIYQSWSQIRDGVKVSLENPPSRVQLELDGCPITNGVCPWDTFINIMEEFM